MCMDINVDITSHTVQLFFLILIFAKINHIFRELWKELRLTGTESWRPRQVFLNLLSCGQQHKQTDEAVLQCAEVLQGEGSLLLLQTHDNSRKNNNCQVCKTPHTGSEGLAEKRQNPARTNTE